MKIRAAKKKQNKKVKAAKARARHAKEQRKKAAAGAGRDGDDHEMDAADAEVNAADEDVAIAEADSGEYILGSSGIRRHQIHGCHLYSPFTLSALELRPRLYLAAIFAGAAAPVMANADIA